MDIQKKIKSAVNPTAKKLWQIMEDKKTDLCLSADVTSWNELLRLANLLGPKICLLKTHIDIITDLPPDFADQLIKLKNLHNFLIFEDRKFADIGNTVKMQYAEGIYKIVDWTDITNCHLVPGPGIIEGLREVGLPKGRGLLLLAEMTPKGNLATGDYTKKGLEWAEQYDDFVIGFIGTRQLSDNPKFMTMSPGIKLSGGGDSLGQQYQTPDQARQGGSDILIVGRGLYEAGDPLSEADKYLIGFKN